MLNKIKPLLTEKILIIDKNIIINIIGLNVLNTKESFKPLMKTTVKRIIPKNK